MSAGRVILIVLGVIGVLFGLALLAGGGFLLWTDRTQRQDGYLTTPTERFATATTYAIGIGIANGRSDAAKSRSIEIKAA